MSAGGALAGSARSVIREIDNELNHLGRWEASGASERVLLLSARAVLATKVRAGSGRRRVSQEELSAYLAEHPGSWPAQIAEALQAPATNVSSHLHRGGNRPYERREDGWYLRSDNG